MSIRDRLEVAKPERDRGIDPLPTSILTGRVIGSWQHRFNSKRIARQAFGLDAKYEKFPELLLAYLWHVTSPTQLETFCLTYAEALAIAEKKAWTKTASWAKGRYDNTRPGAELRRLLGPHRMAPGRWMDKLRRSSPFG